MIQMIRVPSPAKRGVDFLRDGSSRRRQTAAAPQSERKKSFHTNDNTVRAEEAPLFRRRLEALSAHFTTLPLTLPRFAGEGIWRLPAP